MTRETQKQKGAPAGGKPDQRRLGKLRRRKGGDRERELVNLLKSYGLKARRTAPLQNAGGAPRGDVEVQGSPFWIECKGGARVRLRPAMEQAITDAPEGLTPLVVWREDRGEWMVTARLTDVLELVVEVLDRTEILEGRRSMMREEPDAELERRVLQGNRKPGDPVPGGLLADTVPKALPVVEWLKAQAEAAGVPDAFTVLDQPWLRESMERLMDERPVIITTGKALRSSEELIRIPGQLRVIAEGEDARRLGEAMRPDPDSDEGITQARRRAMARDLAEEETEFLGKCPGCGTTREECKQYREGGAIACCPDCRHPLAEQEASDGRPAQ